MTRPIAQSLQLLLVLFLWGAPGLAQEPIPSLSARVTDSAGVLSVAERQALEAKLRAIESSKGSQVAVLVVSTTQPETVEQYALRVVEQWKLGRAKVDDGVLILLAMRDRSIRIEVGYGLEGALSDVVTSRIIREIMIPSLREGRTFAALDGAVDAVSNIISGEELPAPQSSSSDSGQWVGFFVILPLIIGDALRSIFGRPLGAGVAFLIGLGIGYFLNALVVGVVGGLFMAMIVALSSSLRFPGGRGSGGFRTGGFSSGGFGGMSGGGSWGGGGGGFGGGGASGRW